MLTPGTQPVARSRTQPVKRRISQVIRDPGPFPVFDLDQTTGGPAPVTLLVICAPPRMTRGSCHNRDGS